ncbi:MAG: Flp pilus assembly complex ATPase component TadA [Deltaproteobacteria bacterium]|nr:Flp pilus assembly complex ATPase component TadA [Deltaproteobacteria bacterium]
MFTVVITEKGGEQRRQDFDKAEVNIGRVQGNDIILPKGNVSKRHSRIVLKDGKFIIVDLKSTNGTYVNGRKITSPLVIKGTDKIYIGDFIISVEEPGGAALQETVAASTPAVALPPPAASSPAASDPGRRPTMSPPPPPPKRKPRPTSEEDEPAPPSRELPRPSGGPILDRPSSPGPMITAPQAALRPTGSPVRRSLGRDTVGPDTSDASGMPAMPSVEPEPVVAPRPKTAPQPTLGRIAVPPPAVEPPARRSAPAPVVEPPARDPRREKQLELQREIQERLVEILDLRRVDAERLADEELWEKAENAICDVVEGLDSEGSIPSFVDQDQLIKDVLHEALGLGPLEDLLADETVDQILVNRADRIYVDRGGRLELSVRGFSSDKTLLGVIERIVMPLGRRIDDANPLVDTRMKDGSRINAVIPPLAVKGPCLTISKSRRRAFSGEELVRGGCLSQPMLDFLQLCVGARRNIIVSGGSGAGKTTLLGVLGSFISEAERVVTVEDATELQLQHEHWVQLESRPPDLEGSGGVPLRELVRNSLRMRPDRLIVGECRGAETLDLLQAMNSGRDGSLASVSAASPREALERLETMALLGGMDYTRRAVREQAAAAIQVIAHVTRYADGSRRVTQICEVGGLEGDAVVLQDLFSFRVDGTDDQGRPRGRFASAGKTPRFVEEQQRRGVPVNAGLFRE